jgi:hypothetical protein
MIIHSYSSSIIGQANEVMVQCAEALRAFNIHTAETHGEFFNPISVARYVMKTQVPGCICKNHHVQ